MTQPFFVKFKYTKKGVCVEEGRILKANAAPGKSRAAFVINNQY